jgi:hypothetical protein
MIAQLERKGGEGFSPSEVEKLTTLRARYRRLVPTPDGFSEPMLLRISYAHGPPTARALRRPVEDVIDIRG